MKHLLIISIAQAHLILMQYKRSDRLGLEIQRALADIIRNDLHDPRIGTLASIVKVDLSTDLSYCKVYITVYGSDEEKQNTFIGLEKAKGFIKRQLSGQVKMRKMPEITFVPDDSIAYSIHISEILNKIKEEEK